MNLFLFLIGSISKLNHLIVLVLLLILLQADIVSSYGRISFEKKIFFYLVLNLRKKVHEQQYLSISNTNDYLLIYKPLFDLPTRDTCLIVDISKATKRISLEEKFRLERRSDHYICKMSEFLLAKKKFGQGIFHSRNQ